MYYEMDGMGGWLDSLKSFGKNLLDGAIQAGGSSLLDKWGIAPKAPAAPAAPAVVAPGTPAAAQPTTRAMVAQTAKSTWPILAVVGAAVVGLGAVIYLKRKS